MTQAPRSVFPLQASARLAAKPLILSLITIMLAACGTTPPAPRPAAEPEPVRAQRYTASFDCTQPETPVQLYVCRDAALAQADQQLHAAWRHQVRTQDLAGRAELLAAHRHWQLSLYSRCGITAAPDEAQALPAAPLACLQRAWQARTDALRATALPASPAGAGASQHPLAAYVMFREAQWLEPALCTHMTTALNVALGQSGSVDAARLAGARKLAGVGTTTDATLPDGRVLSVQQHDAGPYGSYALRAKGLLLNGQRLIDDRSVPAWMLDLPNAGGSFSSTSSQTGDYAGIEVFIAEQRTFVLVTQTWGYYASAARGESPHAALYELTGDNLQRRCLWRTYTTPPVAQALRLLPQFKTLQSLLDEAAGADSPRLPPDDRRDAGLLAKELQWTLLNMPLLAVREADFNGRWPLLRQRHDEALEALFAWSERNVASKQLYRRIMPLISVAHAELLRAFKDSEGLKPDEARAAADLMLMTALARAAERWQDPAIPRPPLANHAKPRWAVAPPAGELERHRAYGSLHSALLNRAPDTAVDDLWRRAWGSVDRVGDAAAAAGPAGDTPLMAAVRSPERVARLLAAGADANARNAWGKTALMTAAQADQAEVVQALLAAGADPLARTALWQADGAGGLDNDEGARAGSTALVYAAGSASPALIERLLAVSGEVVSVGDAACKALDGNPKVPAGQRPALRQRLCPGR